MRHGLLHVHQAEVRVAAAARGRAARQGRARAERAASKIAAGWRGLKTREALADMPRQIFTTVYDSGHLSQGMRHRLCKLPLVQEALMLEEEGRDGLCGAGRS